MCCSYEIERLSCYYWLKNYCTTCCYVQKSLETYLILPINWYSLGFSIQDSSSNSSYFLPQQTWRHENLTKTEVSCVTRFFVQMVTPYLHHLSWSTFAKHGGEFFQRPKVVVMDPVPFCVFFNDVNRVENWKKQSKNLVLRSSVTLETSKKNVCCCDSFLWIFPRENRGLKNPRIPKNPLVYKFIMVYVYNSEICRKPWLWSKLGGCLSLRSEMHRNGDVFSGLDSTQIQAKERSCSQQDLQQAGCGKAELILATQPTPPQTYSPQK